MSGIAESTDVFDSRAKDIYYNTAHPAALGGASRLANALRDTSDRKKTREWLSREDAYTLHRPAPTRFPRRPTIARGPGVQMQADLMDVRSHSDANDGVKFLLTCIDVFSRRAWAEPLHNKSGGEVAEALRQPLSTASYSKLQTDK